MIIEVVMLIKSNKQERHKSSYTEVVMLIKINKQEAHRFNFIAYWMIAEVEAYQLRIWNRRVRQTGSKSLALASSRLGNVTTKSRRL